MGSCKSKIDKKVEKKPEPQVLELKVEKRPLVELQDKITYEGEWLGDNKHGYGIQRWPDGAVFEGNFVNGTANGYGVFIHTDGDKYEGDWQNDRAHGYGTYTHSDGSKYVGEWRNDKKHGKAIESWVDGSHFEGSYAYGLKQGFGKFSWHDGSRYIGNFDANQINGYGIYYWNDGRVYTGCWQKNHMFGYGKFDWTDHRCYEGQYINDKKDGDGKFTWPDGRAYIGQWKNGKQHGIGIFYNIKKEGKVGEWRDGSRLRWIKSSLENGELVGEGLALREEYSKQREELLKANDLYESYKKLPKNDMELQQLRIMQKFDECLSTLELTSKDSSEKNKEPEKIQLNSSVQEPQLISEKGELAIDKLEDNSIKDVVGDSKNIQESGKDDSEIELNPDPKTEKTVEKEFDSEDVHKGADGKVEEVFEGNPEERVSDLEKPTADFTQQDQDPVRADFADPTDPEVHLDKELVKDSGPVENVDRISVTSDHKELEGGNSQDLKTENQDSNVEANINSADNADNKQENLMTSQPDSKLDSEYTSGPEVNSSPIHASNKDISKIDDQNIEEVVNSDSNDVLKDDLRDKSENVDEEKHETKADED